MYFGLIKGFIRECRPQNDSTLIHSTDVISETVVATALIFFVMSSEEYFQIDEIVFSAPALLLLTPIFYSGHPNFSSGKKQNKIRKLIRSSEKR